MSHTTHTDPIVFALSEHVSTVDNDGPAAPAQHASDAWKLNAPTTVDGPTTAPVTSVLRAFVNYPTLRKGEGSVTDHAEPTDYSDGYGGTYAKGE